MSDVFLSYANEDRVVAATLAGALQQRGLSIWWDHEIPPGRSFDEVIEEALGNASCVVVLWSQHSVRSRWVRIEAAAASDRGVLVPVTIEDVIPPLAFRDLQAVRLIGWVPDRKNAGFDRLLDALQTRVGGSALSAASGAAIHRGRPVDAGRPVPSAFAKAISNTLQVLRLFPPIRLPTRERLLSWLVRVEVLASWLIVVAITIPIPFPSSPLAGDTAFLAFWTSATLCVGSGVLLGILSWRDKFRLGVIEGWFLPPLAVGLTIAILIFIGELYGKTLDEKTFLLGALLLPLSITLGGYRTIRAIRARYAQPLPRQ